LSLDIVQQAILESSIVTARSSASRNWIQLSQRLVRLFLARTVWKGYRREMKPIPTAFFFAILCPLLLGCDSSSKSIQYNKMHNPVNYFEIPVTDFQRAIKFYETVFECRLEIKSIDGNEMAIFDGGIDLPGVFGAIAYGPSYKPSKDGTRVYFSTQSIDEVLARVLANGGQIEYPKTDVADIGFVAEFIDSEGNRIAVHEPHPPK
jgi:uncharacterized protein